MESVSISLLPLVVSDRLVTLGVEPFLGLEGGVRVGDGGAVVGRLGGEGGLGFPAVAPGAGLSWLEDAPPSV